MFYYSTFQSKLGRIFYAHDSRNVVAVDIQGRVPQALRMSKNIILSKKGMLSFERELRSYLRGDLKKFRTKIKPFNIKGFSKKVLDALLLIPYGETASYGTIARRIKNPKAARAVGNACGRNPCPIIIPCHRVVKGDGKLGGFTGGLRYKKLLLAIEHKEH